LNAPDGYILTRVRAQFPPDPPARLGVAISGGGDSTALLHILAQCFEPGKVRLFAATVDHGLRPEAAEEARQAGVLCKSLGVPHEILKWESWDKTGNLQDQARRARYRLLGEWATSHTLDEVAIGHTLDDQAETVVMRMVRSAGVTGLSAMPVRRKAHGTTISRPLLGVTRAQLRDYLRRNAIIWSEDPSNNDLRYDRIKVRRALEVLEPLGLTAQVLSDVAHNMRQAHEALNQHGFLAAHEIVTIVGGDVVMDLPKFRSLPDETARRLFQHALLWISGAQYAPRRAPLIEALNAARQGNPATLSGCRVLVTGARIWICREFNAVRRIHSPCDQLWDGRWRLLGGDASGCEIRPLGQHGLTQCPNWRETGSPGAALTATPAVWRDDNLVAAPLAGMANGWAAKLLGGSEDFYTSLLSH
jgi:tRNA(Ile)-lysidine synthase